MFRGARASAAASPDRAIRERVLVERLGQHLDAALGSAWRHVVIIADDALETDDTGESHSAGRRLRSQKRIA